MSERAKQRAEPTRATCVSVYLRDLLDTTGAVPLLPLSLNRARGKKKKTAAGSLLFHVLILLHPSISNILIASAGFPCEVWRKKWQRGLSHKDGEKPPQAVGRTALTAGEAGVGGDGWKHFRSWVAFIWCFAKATEVIYVEILMQCL